MPRRNTLPPLSDEELAAAEQTELMRTRDRLAEIEDEKEQTRLAEAGDPEAREALAASASVLASTPIGDSENGTAPKVERKKEAPARNAKETRRGRPKSRPSERHPSGDEPREREKPNRVEEDQAKAYLLMDAAYRKWAKLARSDLRKANRELAIDLGKDTALYLRAGVIRLSDIQDTIQKLMAVKAGKEDDGEQDFEDNLEVLRRDLRGE